MNNAVDRDLSDHVPFLDGQGKPRCEACGYLFPCPDLRLTPRALDAAERALLEVLGVGVGFTVYRRMPEGSEIVGEGGVVVAAWDDDEGVHLRVVDFPHGKQRMRTLRLHEIDPATIGLPNTTTVVWTARRIASQFAKGKGLVAGGDLEDLSDALHLLRAVV